MTNWSGGTIAIGEKYDPQRGDVIGYGPHRIMCDVILSHDKFYELTSPGVDVIYTDPPWNDGILKRFYKLAGREAPMSFSAMMQSLVLLYMDICPTGQIIIEMGTKGWPTLEVYLRNAGFNIHEVMMATYGSKRTKQVVIMGFFATTQPVILPQEPLHESQIIHWVTETFVKPGMKFVDPCCGVGLQLFTALDAGATVFGCELIPKKFAKAMRKFRRRG